MDLGLTGVQEGRIGEQGTERNGEQERRETPNLYTVWVPSSPSYASHQKKSGVSYVPHKQSQAIQWQESLTTPPASSPDNPEGRSL